MSRFRIVNEDGHTLNGVDELDSISDAENLITWVLAHTDIDSDMFIEEKVNGEWKRVEDGKQ